MTVLFIFGSMFIVAFAYGGYVLPAWIWMKLIPNRKIKTQPVYPTVTFVVAAYNEEDIIAEKIKNCLSLKYPKEKVKFLFITDGSTDLTPTIVSRYPDIELLHESTRNGKSMAINRAMVHIDSEVTVFSDANTFLNADALMLMAEAFFDPLVGGVAGEKKVLQLNQGGANAVGEGLYWKYESWLKAFDSRFYSAVGAAGELFGIRTKLYTHTPKTVLLDDFIISMRICLKGLKIAYVKDAIASEMPSASLKEEKKRKTRIATGAFQSVVMLKALLLFWRHPRLSYLYIAHRLLRWVVCPFLLPLIFIFTACAALGKQGIVYDFLCLAQLLFYAFALVGWWLDRKQNKKAMFSIPYYFVFMNANMYVGLYRFLFKTQSGIWDRATRLNLEK